MDRTTEGIITAIDLHDEPTRTVAVVRQTVAMADLPAFYGAAYDSVSTAVTEAGGRLVGPPIGWYHRMPTTTTGVSAAFPVDGVEPGRLTAEVEVRSLPGGRCLVEQQSGPYDALPAAWARVEAKRAALGVDGRGDFWEEYVAMGEDPSGNQTRLVLPLR